MGAWPHALSSQRTVAQTLVPPDSLTASADAWPSSVMVCIALCVCSNRGRVCMVCEEGVGERLEAGSLLGCGLNKLSPRL